MSNKVYRDKRLAQILRDYSGIDHVDDRLNKMAEDAGSQRYVIPVLGVQGAGKSSFLNALLFNDIILPVEVSETTCIPTEISYADVVVPRATVFFTDGKPSQEIACTEKSLRQFVHQEFNPGNCRHVERVTIQLKHSMLENGLVIVDLPGVGSGTIENQERTMNYLNNSCGGIFLLAESLKTPDAVFISAALPKLNNVFFVQNRWSGETQADTQEAADYNHNILIAKVKELHIPIKLIPEFHILAVKKALDAAIKNDEVAFQQSGMSKFQKELADFASSWQEFQRQAQNKILQGFVNTSINKIEELTAILKREPLQELQKLEERRRTADVEIAEKEVQIREARHGLEQQKIQLHAKLNTLIDNARGELRTAVRDLIDNEVVVGEQLQSAFQDHVSQLNTQIYQEILSDMNTITANLREQLAELATGKEFGAQNLSVAGDFSHKSNVHSLYSPIASNLLSFAGGAAAYAALNCWNPSGWIVGLGVVAAGLLGHFLGNAVGNIARQAHIKSQQAEAMKELFKSVQNFADQARKTYTVGIDDYISTIGDSLSSWFNARRNAIDREIKGLTSALNQSEAEKARRLANMVEDLAYLKKLQNTLETKEEKA